MFKGLYIIWVTVHFPLLCITSHCIHFPIVVFLCFFCESLWCWGWNPESRVCQAHNFSCIEDTKPLMGALVFCLLVFCLRGRSQAQVIQHGSKHLYLHSRLTGIRLNFNATPKGLCFMPVLGFLGSFVWGCLPVSFCVVSQCSQG